MSAHFPDGRSLPPHSAPLTRVLIKMPPTLPLYGTVEEYNEGKVPFSCVPLKGSLIVASSPFSSRYNGYDPLRRVKPSSILEIVWDIFLVKWTWTMPNDDDDVGWKAHLLGDCGVGLGFVTNATRGLSWLDTLGPTKLPLFKQYQTITSFIKLAALFLFLWTINTLKILWVHQGSSCSIAFKNFPKN